MGIKERKSEIVQTDVACIIGAICTMVTVTKANRRQILSSNNNFLLIREKYSKEFRP